MMKRTFDWQPRFDQRSRAFRVAAVKGEIRECDWRHGPILDQGSDGACIGFAAVASLASTKRQLKFPDGDGLAHVIYNFAKTVDEWDGDDYEGTSVLAGMKALKHHGYITRYEWAFGLQDVLWALSWRGPVQIGVWWYSSMFDTDKDGMLRVSGIPLGGHSVLLSGVHPKTETVTLTNSWGPGWGRKGQADLSFSDLDRLLHEAGEAVTILKAR